MLQGTYRDEVEATECKIRKRNVHPNDGKQRSVEASQSKCELDIT